MANFRNRLHDERRRLLVVRRSTLLFDTPVDPLDLLRCEPEDGGSLRCGNAVVEGVQTQVHLGVREREEELLLALSQGKRVRARRALLDLGGDPQGRGKLIDLALVEMRDRFQVRRPIPILDEEVLRHTLIRDEDIITQIVDYSEAYPNFIPGSLGTVNYKQLKSGSITINGREVPASNISSYLKAREIADILKDRIKRKEFLLTEPVAALPGEGDGYSFKPLKARQ